MARRFATFMCLAVSAAVALTPIFLSAEAMYSAGPNDGLTGAPGEGLCTDCHSQYEINSGDGVVKILAPENISAGQEVLITVELKDPGQERWGFELTAVDADGNGVGNFTIIDPVNTQLSSDPASGRDYVKHTPLGTQSGTPDGPVMWTAKFDIPEEPPESFFDVWCCVVGANGDSGPLGDYVYSGHMRIYVASPGVPSSSPIGLIILTMLLVATAFYVLTRRRGVA